MARRNLWVPPLPVVDNRGRPHQQAPNGPRSSGNNPNQPGMGGPALGGKLARSGGAALTKTQRAWLSLHPRIRQDVKNYGWDVLATQFPNGIPVPNLPKMPKMPGQRNSPRPQPEGPAFKGVPGNFSYALSKAPNPRPVRLNSNVQPNTYSNDYMTASEGVCAPLHMSTVTLQVPTNVANPLTGYFQNTLCFDIQTRAQANISFDLDIVNQFSATQLTTAFNAAITSLQVYYYYTSILSYESDTRNKNEGMIALRKDISPQIMSDLTQLGRRLEDTPIPPHVVEWVKYMNGNYLSGDDQGAPLLKIAPSFASLMAPLTSPTGPAAALALLTAPATNTVFSIMRRAIPQWRVGMLYDVTPIPVFDKNFLTIFANLPSGHRNVTNFLSNKIVLTTDTIGYNAYHNKLDGVAFAMCSVTDNSKWMPGLVQLSDPLSASIPDTRYSYYKIGANSAFYAASRNAYLTACRPETSTFDAASVQTQVHLPAAAKCQNVCANSLTQTAQNVLDFLFDTSKIPSKGKLNSFSNSGTTGQI
jgi:hypothetical protein